MPMTGNATQHPWAGEMSAAVISAVCTWQLMQMEMISTLSSSSDCSHLVWMLGWPPN